VYFGLFCLWFAQIAFVFTGIVGQWLPDDAIMWQMDQLEPVTRWVGRHVFGIDAVLRHSGSGDQAAIWMMVFCILTIAAVATAVWTLVDRRRGDYTRLMAWFLAFLRLCLGGQLLFYGVAKVIPTQMPEPPLAALLQPFGDLTPMAVLWLQIGTSLPYEMTLGAVELLAGALLFVPRTATLGALLALAGMTQVFILNMTYDVPVKVLSFHLLSMSLILLAPQARRLANVLVFERSSGPASQPQLFCHAKANRIATAAQVALAVWALIGVVAGGWEAWHEYGGGRVKPELHGIWSVTEYSVDGRPVPPLITDQDRWQRLIIDEPGVVIYQKMDGELVLSSAAVDSHQISMPELGANFAIERPTPDRLRLDGRIDGRVVTMSLEQVDLGEFILRSRGFHWVQDYASFT
jgi:hypothetical protein